MSKIPSIDFGESIRMEVAVEWLLRLQEDKLNETEISQWIEWCESDRCNLLAFEHVQSLWRATVDHPPDNHQLTQLQRDDTADRFGNRLRVSSLARRLLAVAASAAVCLGAAAVLMYNLGNHWTRGAPPERTIAGVDSVETTLAINQRINLPDGSKVEMGAKSALDVDFAGSGRKLRLRHGQAFFRVKHDPIHPFVVYTGGLQVIAIGTAFDIRISDSQIAVTVQEGVVKLIDGTRGAAPITVAAGNQLIIETSTGEIHSMVVDPAVALAWRVGRLEFTGDTLDVVISSVNRYSQRPVILGDPALGKLTFTGTVFLSSIDESLDAMKQVFPIEVKRTEREVIFLNRR
jgi:transmembrane sensor